MLPVNCIMKSAHPIALLPFVTLPASSRVQDCPPDQTYHNPGDMCKPGWWGAALEVCRQWAALQPQAGSPSATAAECNSRSTLLHNGCVFPSFPACSGL